MSEEQFSIEQGRTEKLTFTVQRDWCDLMPISHGAARLHRILRSMMIETKESGPVPTHPLTLDRLCWLMSSTQKKAVGEQTVRDYRAELTTAGMLDVLPGRCRNDPPRYVIHDIPPDGWSGWRNAWHVDGAYRKDWRTNWPLPSDTESNNGHFGTRFTGGSPSESGQFGTRSAVPHDTPGGKHGSPGGKHGSPGVTSAPTCENGAPKKAFNQAFNESLSLASPEGEAQATASPRPERESDASKDQDPRSGPVLDTAHEAAQKAVRKLKGEPGGKVKARIVLGLEKSIQGGLPPSRAVAWLNSKIGDTAHSPELIHAANVENLPDPRPEDAEIHLRELCTGCDDRGATTVDAFTFGPGSSVCLHGKPPRKRRADKKCGRCPRVVMNPDADLCARCQRETGVAEHAKEVS